METAAHARQAGRSTTHTAVLVLVIGAAMAAVVWAGEDLHEAARDLMTRRDIETVRTLVLRYDAAWSALPGDDPRAAARWGLPPALAGRSGDGRVDGPLLDLVNTETESHLAWRHLAAAGMGWTGAWGRVGFADAPLNRYGGAMGLVSGAFGLKAALCLTNLPAGTARRLDAALDDGDARTGAVRAGVAAHDVADERAEGNRTLRMSGLPSEERRAVTLCVEITPR